MQNLNVLMGELPRMMQMAQLAIGTVRAVVAALKANGGGADLPDDAELIRIFADNSEAGVAECDALIARLRALAAREHEPV